MNHGSLALQCRSPTRRGNWIENSLLHTGTEPPLLVLCALLSFTCKWITAATVFWRRVEAGDDVVWADGEFAVGGLLGLTSQTGVPGRSGLGEHEAALSRGASTAGVPLSVLTGRLHDGGELGVWGRGLCRQGQRSSWGR